MRSSAAKIEQSGAPMGVAVAVALHAAVILATLLTWSTRTLDISDESPPIVPVDLVTIAPKTNIAPTVKEQLKAPPKEQEAQSPAPQDALPTPAAPQEAAAPPPDETAVAPLPNPIKQVAPKAKPQDKSKEFDLDALDKLIDKRAAAPSTLQNAKVANRSTKGIGAMNANTTDLVDALRSQISRCWSPPIGAPNPERLIVSFEIFLNPDGTIAQQPQLTSGTPGDPFLRAAADAAQRAIYECQPYRLPADRYTQWRDINFTFDPGKMTGQ
jgi:outer membrane biosynthesis protein TonB